MDRAVLMAKGPKATRQDEVNPTAQDKRGNTQYCANLDLLKQNCGGWTHWVGVQSPLGKALKYQNNMQIVSHLCEGGERVIIIVKAKNTHLCLDSDVGKQILYTDAIMKLLFSTL